MTQTVNYFRPSRQIYVLRFILNNIDIHVKQSVINAQLSTLRFKK